MTRAHNPDDICAMCDEYSVKLADPACRDIGMGRCSITEVGKPLWHVAWDHSCISFGREPDVQRLEARRQCVAKWRQAAEDAKNKQ